MKSTKTTIGSSTLLKEQHTTRSILATESLTTTGQTIMDPPSTIFTKQLKKLSCGFSVRICISSNNLENPKHVIVVHCNSGKGRTGTAICAILLYMGFCSNMDDCLRFYGHRRFTCGKGVSQPCQLRYLYYFEGYYKKQIKSPSVKRLTSIQFNSVPTVSNGGCRPSFEVFHCEGMKIDKVFSY